MEAMWGGITAFGAQILFLGIRTRLGSGYVWLGAVLLGLAAVFFLPVWVPAAWPGFSGAFAEIAFYGLGATGILCLAGMTRLLGRFLDLHAANRETMETLAAAFNSLRESAGLTALGASAASISHEIRNYAATLKGNAVLMRREMDAEGYGAEVDLIRATADKLEIVSRDIAVYSSSGLPSAKTRFTLDAPARACVRQAFPERASDIHIGAWPQGMAVRGDEGKLERVFLNLFRNAFEAGACAIRVRFTAFGTRVVAAVEDDGAGCAPGDLERLAIPFFSGKEGGTGLGCAIVVSTLAGHGASFRAYTRNALGSGARGLILNMVFPLDGPTAWEAPVMPVVSDDPAARPDMIAPLVNLGIQPIYLARYGVGAPASASAFPLLAESSVAPGLGSAWPRGVLAVDKARIARWIVPGAEARTFLFTEENLAGVAAREGIP